MCRRRWAPTIPRCNFMRTCLWWCCLQQRLSSYPTSTSLVQSDSSSTGPLSPLQDEMGALTVCCCYQGFSQQSACRQHWSHDAPLLLTLPALGPLAFA